MAQTPLFNANSRLVLRILVAASGLVGFAVLIVLTKLPNDSAKGFLIVVAIFDLIIGLINWGVTERAFKMISGPRSARRSIMVIFFSGPLIVGYAYLAIDGLTMNLGGKESLRVCVFALVVFSILSWANWLLHMVVTLRTELRNAFRDGLESRDPRK